MKTAACSSCLSPDSVYADATGWNALCKYCRLFKWRPDDEVLQPLPEEK